MARNKKSIFCILSFIICVYLTGAEDSDSGISFIPHNYKLMIETNENHFQDGDSAKMTFSGTVTIDFDFNKPDNFKKDFEIILNASPNTTVTSMLLKGVKAAQTFNFSEGMEVVPNSICKGAMNNDKYYVNCTKDAVEYKKFSLELKFTNLFGNDMTGFYRSSYEDSTGKNIWLLTTHFEPIFARKAFPCFDRPDLKAYFDIEIKVPQEIKTVLSNTPVNGNPDTEGNFKVFKFKKTPLPMATYLVAFTASNFESTSAVEFTSSYPSNLNTKRQLKTYGRKDVINKGDGNLAQLVAQAALDELANYLGLGYAFEKVDQIGIPDFSAGAMENWGHISFREKSLYYNKDSSSTSTLQANVLTITHELVHQWFGNLVTLESWDYIWLNEAFANYLEYVIASKLNLGDIKPSEWNLMNQMVVNEIHLRAFEVDGFNTSKSLNDKIPNENLIYSSFNDIPYAKGASVLRMWNMIIKGEGFKESLQHYIRQRKEKSAGPSHLYESFKAKAGMTEEYFKSWTDQSGYPVVQVKRVNETYELSQSPFFWEKVDGNRMWHIMITYSTNTNKTFGMTPALALIKDPIKINGTFKWIIVNNQQSGYYRVNYDKENWEALSNALLEKNQSDIPELNRAQILNDVFSLARSLQKEYVNYSVALKLAKYLKTETSFIPWKTALNAFDFLQTKLFTDDIYKKFKVYVMELIQPHFKALNPSNLDHVGKLMNVEISRWACSLGHEPCVTESQKLFNDSTYSKYPDTQEIVLCTVVRNDNKAWDDVFEKYKKEKSSATKIMYISALGCSGNGTKIDALLQKTLEENSEIRKQDLSFVLSSVYNGNLKNIDIALKFVDENFAKIAKAYGGINPLGRAMLGIAKKLSTKAQVDKLESLAKKIKSSSEGKASLESVNSALEIASSNLKWINERMNQCKTFFNSGSLVSYSLALLFSSLLFVFQF